jgi:PAS domain S-box-containing protein
MKDEDRTNEQLVREVDGLSKRVAELESAQNELKKSQEQYMDLYDYAPVGYVALNEKSLIQKVNLAGVALLGVERRTLLQSSFSNFVHSDHQDTYRHHLVHIFQTESKQSCEVELIRGDGTQLQVRLNSVAVKGSRDGAIECLTTITDITDLGEREQDLLESSTLLNALFEAAPDLVSVHNRDLQIVLSNWKGFGFVPEEKRKIGVHCYEAYMNRTGPCEPCHALEVFEAGKAKSFEFMSSVDGRIKQINLFPIPDESGIVRLVAEHLTDITKLRSAEEALRSSEERFRALFEQASECIFVKDTDLRYSNVNPAVTKLFDMPESEFVGRRAEDVYGEEIGNQISERSSRSLAGETVEYEQLRPIRGSLILFRDVWIPLKGNRGEIIGVCGISRYETWKEVPVERSRTKIYDYPSKIMQNTLKMALHAARSEGVVLLQGESGSGKDHLARWIHEHSKRASGPFFSINCAALPRELAESELFGHERGAFTGASVRKKGQLELAEGGTILLNEVGELDLSLQSKLLAFLDTNSFLRVGGEKSVWVDARLIAATHRDLDKEVAQGRFLQPLYYRLNIFPIDVPPLRHRKEDIPVLVEDILLQLGRDMQYRKLPVIDGEHLRILSRYHWPGNIRELRNVIERSLMLWQEGIFRVYLPRKEVSEASIGDKEWSHPIQYVRGKTLRAVHQEATRYLCEQALLDCNGNKMEAAKSLGVSRDAFYRYIKKLRIKS